jgi:hypothetical protein
MGVRSTLFTRLKDGPSGTFMQNVLNADEDGKRLAQDGKSAMHVPHERPYSFA